MAADWYMTRQGKKYGPFTEEKLRELASTNRLLPNDLVWKQGMAQWATAGTVQSLFPPRQPSLLPGNSAALPSRRLAPVPESGMPVIDVGAPSLKSGARRPAAKGTRKHGQNDKLMIAGGIGIVVLALCGIAYKVIQDRRETQYWVDQAEQSRALNEVFQQRLREEGLR
jgi:hypothetical protein